VPSRLDRPSVAELWKRHYGDNVVAGRAGIRNFGLKARGVVGGEGSVPLKREIFFKLIATLGRD